MQKPAATHQLDPLMRELEAVLKERGTTQLFVQQQLGWGTTRISDLKANPSSLKMEDLLAILDLLGVDPMVFLERVHGKAELSADLAWVCESLEALATLEADLESRVTPPAQVTPAARWAARSAARLLTPLTGALRAGASVVEVQKALAETLGVALELCEQGLESDSQDVLPPDWHRSCNSY
jgi:hypothetical protein